MGRKKKKQDVELGPIGTWLAIVIAAYALFYNSWIKWVVVVIFGISVVLYVMYKISQFIEWKNNKFNNDNLNSFIPKKIKYNPEGQKNIYLTGKRYLEPNRIANAESINLDLLKKDLLVVDTETTGTSLNDEILQLSIIDFEGNVLFDDYFCPEYTTDWPEARKVNHITKAMVKNKSTIADSKESLKKILKDKIIIGYNIDFDYRYLVNAGLIEDNYRTIDVMKPFAVIKGEWNDFYNEYRYQKLETCAAYFKYSWTGSAHNSLEDAKATLYCFKQINNYTLVEWKYIDKVLERENKLKAAFECDDIVSFYVRNTTKQKWKEGLLHEKKCIKEIGFVEFRYFKIKGSSAKPILKIYHNDDMICETRAGTNLYNQVAELVKNGKYKFYIEAKKYDDQIDQDFVHILHIAKY